MRRLVLLGIVVIAVGGLAGTALLLFRSGSPAGPQCPLSFSEFAVASKAGKIRVSGQAGYANGAPFAKGPVLLNLTFVMPGCGALPLTATTEGDGRFLVDASPTDAACAQQGGTVTASTRAGCSIEGMTQGEW
ncbi:MAG: hypothetical protein HYY96_15785 [Candidatus Tectomicrobia bacterium]|nr:hypothetical protein [Candidatus Tectomicrobia bacterium]